MGMGVGGCFGVRSLGKRDIALSNIVPHLDKEQM